MKDDVLKSKIEKLLNQIEESIVISLLLIAKLSQSSSFTFPQFKENLWEKIRKNKNGNYIDAITEVLLSLEETYPFVDRLIEQNSKQNKVVLNQLMDILIEITLEDLPLGLIYESYIQIMLPSYCTAKECGSFYTPKSLAQCLATMIAHDGTTAYDPCCGSGMLLLELQKYCAKDIELYAQTSDEKSYLTTYMNLILNGKTANLGETPADTLLEDLHKDMKFDYIIANPPFNAHNWYHDDDSIEMNDERWNFGFPPRSNANFAWLQHIIKHLAPNGRAAIILPNGTLTSQIEREAKIREGIIQNNLVEAIITLPSGLFYSTRIPCCIWVLSKANHRKNEVLFIDATKIMPKIKKEITPSQMEMLHRLIEKYRNDELNKVAEWYSVTSLKEIKENEYLLSPNLYKTIQRPQPFEIRARYEKLLEIIDKLVALPIDEKLLASIKLWKKEEVAQAWQKKKLLQMYSVMGGVIKKKEYFGKGTPLLDVKTILHSSFVPNPLSSYVLVKKAEEIQYDIRYGDVFLNRTSETIKELACCSVALENQEAVYSGYIKRLRPLEINQIDPCYVACYFASDIYRWEVEKVSTVYTTHASINNQKLEKIALYLPDKITQKKIGKTFFEVWEFQKKCTNEVEKDLIKEFCKLFVEQYVTYPIRCIQIEEENNK